MDKPKYTAVTFRPKNFPFSSGYRVVSMAVLVAYIIDAPIPCITLEDSKKVILLEKIVNKDPNENMMIPKRYIFFLPSISEILPKGRRRTEVANR